MSFVCIHGFLLIKRRFLGSISILNISIIFFKKCTFKEYNKISTSIENDPRSTKSPKNKYLIKFSMFKKFPSLLEIIWISTDFQNFYYIIKLSIINYSYFNTEIIYPWISPTTVKGSDKNTTFPSLSMVANLCKLFIDITHNFIAIDNQFD